MNKELAIKAIDAIEVAQAYCDAQVTIYGDGRISVYAAPKNWGNSLEEEARHKVLGLLTPLVGKLNKRNVDTTIHYEGSDGSTKVEIRRADTCTIVGYKKRVRSIPKMVTKTVEKEEEVESGEYEEEEELIPITDCQIRQGEASEDDIEVPA